VIARAVNCGGDGARLGAELIPSLRTSRKAGRSFRGEYGTATPCISGAVGSFVVEMVEVAGQVSFCSVGHAFVRPLFWGNGLLAVKTRIRLSLFAGCGHFGCGGGLQRSFDCVNRIAFAIRFTPLRMTILVGPLRMTILGRPLRMTGLAYRSG